MMQANGLFPATSSVTGELSRSPLAWGATAKRRLLVSASVLSLAVNFNAAISPPALAVICQNAGAPANNATAGATDGNLQTNTACGLNSNAAGSSGNTAIGVNANASGNFSGLPANDSSNTAVGAGARANGEGSNNTAIGERTNASGDDSDNTAIGAGAEANGEGSSNILPSVSIANASGDGSNNVANGEDTGHRRRQ